MFPTYKIIPLHIIIHIAAYKSIGKLNKVLFILNWTRIKVNKIILYKKSGYIFFKKTPHCFIPASLYSHFS